ncbi:hypothetical protein F5Y12DRAFT_721053 [Xylaria sp. FL1777]|nr:hypothetical protein F5Y12DRAFT_721053 [Xylaria sp. FL1777]
MMIVPEIKVLGHCLSITKWRPVLALAKNLLNLTHPDDIPTVKRLSAFVAATANKGLRIWGTCEPSSALALKASITVWHRYIKDDHMPTLLALYQQVFDEARVLKNA